MLVRRVDTGEAAELIGLAAIVWIAADEPITASVLSADVAADEAAVAAAVSMLAEAGWIREVAA
mgnify:CR=1 FL=1